MKKSHVRFFHGKASQKKISREKFLRGVAPAYFFNIFLPFLMTRPL